MSVTVPLRAARSGQLTATVTASQLGVTARELERLAHRFLHAYPEDRTMWPSGLTLCESRVAPFDPPRDSVEWVTVWRPERGSDAGHGELTFHTDGVTAEPVTKGADSSTTEKDDSMATTPAAPERTFDEEDREIADALRALEAEQRKDHPPHVRDRIDSAVEHFRRRSHALRHPREAVAIEKAEIDRMRHDWEPGQDLIAQANALARAEGGKPSDHLRTLLQKAAEPPLQPYEHPSSRAARVAREAAASEGRKPSQLMEEIIRARAA